MTGAKHSVSASENSPPSFSSTMYRKKSDFTAGDGIARKASRYSGARSRTKASTAASS